MADVREQTERPPQTQQFRLTGPYSRMVQDAQSKTWSTVAYAKDEMIVPTWEELDAHPGRFEEWPPSGTVLAQPAPPEEPPPPEETPSTRSRR